MRGHLLALAVLCATPALAQSPTDRFSATREQQATAEREIRERIENVENAMNDWDVERMLSNYTSDARVVTAFGDSAEGGQALRQFFQQQRSSPMALGENEIEVERVRLLSPDLAWVDLSHEIEWTAPNGTEREWDLHNVALVRRTPEGWRAMEVRSFRFAPQPGTGGPRGMGRRPPG